MRISDAFFVHNEPRYVSYSFPTVSKLLRAQSQETYGERKERKKTTEIMRSAPEALPRYLTDLRINKREIDQLLYWLRPGKSSLGRTLIQL